MHLFFLDFETTGLNPYQSEIVEVAVKKYGEKDSYDTLMKPKKLPPGLVTYIPPYITNINGITDQMIKQEAISKSEAFYKVLQYIEKHSKEEGPIYIVSHNGTTFDFIFLKRALNDMKQSGSIPNIDLIDEYKIEMIDTLLLSRRLIPGRYQYSQPSLCKTFNIEIEGAHRAMNDVICLEQLYNKLLESFQKENQDNSIQLIQDYIKLRL